MPKAIVCGAGVGGLTAGLSLKAIGFEVEVHEQHPELRTAGVGLNVWPNGAKVLFDLGLKDKFLSTAASMHTYRTVSGDGSETSDIDVSHWMETMGAPLTGVHRMRLNEMIAEAVGLDRIHFGHRLVDLSDDGSKVEIQFENGDTASGDLLVGADGVGSMVREKILGPVSFQSDDLVRWRGIFCLEDAGVPAGVEYEIDAEMGHIGWLPIDSERAYWFGTGEGLAEQDDFEEYFGSLDRTPAPRVLEATQRDTIISNRLVEFTEHLPFWSKGRVTLLGDAAHPMLPGMAQGANQALIDCATLARKLSELDEIETALKEYEQERMPLAERVVEWSRSLFQFDEIYDHFSSETHNPLIDRYLAVARGEVDANAA